MHENQKHGSQTLRLIIAFATIYLVWGSTYYFIQVGVKYFPPMIMGAIRFLVAGGILLAWCIFRGEQQISWKGLKTAFITGIMLLLIGNGAVILAEEWLPSSLVAVLISTVPFWLVILDFPEWKNNLKSWNVLAGLAFGFLSVTFMFAGKVARSFTDASVGKEILGLGILLIGTMSWAGGSIFSKYRSSGSSVVNSSWQMLSAGFAFFIGSLLTSEWKEFSLGSVTAWAWFSIAYLIVFGSIAAYSAYVWLLRERTSAQVGTYAYVNPVIAVVLGVVFAGEQMTGLQFAGLIGILLSVFLINLSKYRS